MLDGQLEFPGPQLVCIAFRAIFYCRDGESA